jgi:hypothetical protein
MEADYTGLWRTNFYSGDISTYPSHSGILAENIVKDIPEIEMASQMLWEEEPLFT